MKFIPSLRNSIKKPHAANKYRARSEINVIVSAIFCGKPTIIWLITINPSPPLIPKIDIGILLANWGVRITPITDNMGIGNNF